MRNWRAEQSPQWTSELLGLSAYMALVALTAYTLPIDVSQPGVKQLTVFLGVLGIWRYGWQAVHFARYLVYRRARFPALRHQADQLPERPNRNHVYLVVTSFRIPPEVTIRVYESVMREAASYANATVIASIVEPADERLLKRLYHRNRNPSFRLLIVRIRGIGKRSAIAYGLRAVAADLPHSQALVVLIDGDTMLPTGTLTKCTPFFSLNPRLGALTTDELPLVTGSRVATDWYNLRFAQRHVHMCSTSLSNRVLTLTGRMSMFRAELATDPRFIETVEFDSLSHWRLGRFRFLTGDDKSTWFWSLRSGYDMLYVADVVVFTMERLPTKNFFESSIKLMFRWFGNMLRNSGRAIALGPAKVKWFPWWSLVDQRISMWTTLIAPTVVIASSIAYGTAQFFYVYLVWVGLTRGLLSFALYGVRGRVSGIYPILIYYNQLVGSLVKTWVLFHMDRQTWTRQTTTRVQHETGWGSQLVYLSAIATFVALVALAFADLDLPSFDFLRQALAAT